MKHHLITDGHGTPLAVLLTGGNRNDATQLVPVLEAIPPVRSRVGRPRRRPDSLFVDRGYDHDVYRDQVRERGIVPDIARCGTRHGTGLGTYRWVIERGFAWLPGFGRLRISVACCPSKPRAPQTCSNGKARVVATLMQATMPPSLGLEALERDVLHYGHVRRRVDGRGLNPRCRRSWEISVLSPG